MTLSPEQAAVAASPFGLTEDEARWLTVVPHKGSLSSEIPSDPLIYRFYELVSVSGAIFA